MNDEFDYETATDDLFDDAATEGGEDNVPTAAAPEYMTRAEAQELAKEAAREASREALKGFFQQQTPTDADEHFGTANTDAVRELRTTMRLEEEMVREARNELEDFPQEAEAELRGWISKFQTVEQLREAKRQGVHKIIAKSSYYDALTNGKVSPKSVGGYVRPEPANSSRPIAVPDSVRREISEAEAGFGVKFSADDIKEYMRNRNA